MIFEEPIFLILLGAATSLLLKPVVSKAIGWVQDAHLMWSLKRHNKKSKEKFDLAKLKEVKLGLETELQGINNKIDSLTAMTRRIERSIDRIVPLDVPRIPQREDAP